ncbi:hypothetical protein Ate01nite_01610 [Actinoplanes teichomyceticus]|nr:hypothetical protein Ate01nite_01610 [Actinoplanes teichomyceticus]
MIAPNQRRRHQPTSGSDLVALSAGGLRRLLAHVIHGVTVSFDRITAARDAGRGMDPSSARAVRNRAATWRKAVARACTASERSGLNAFATAGPWYPQPQVRVCPAD